MLDREGLGASLSGLECEQGLSFAAVVSAGVVLLGSVVLFVSSKTVTTGSVLMTLVVSLCCGQLASALRLLGPDAGCGVHTAARSAYDVAARGKEAAYAHVWAWDAAREALNYIYSSSR